MMRADVTSYLSATAYADRSFANKVVDAVLWDPTRLATTAPNMNLSRVVYHCRAALRRDFHLQVLLAFAPAVWVALVNLGLVLLGGHSGWWLFGGQLVLAYLAVYTVCAWFHPRHPGRQWLPLPLAALTAYFIWRQGAPLVATVLLGMTWPIVLVVFGYRWWNRHRLSAPVLQGQWPHTGLALRRVVRARLQQINAQARGTIAAFLRATGTNWLAAGSWPTLEAFSPCAWTGAPIPSGRSRTSRSLSSWMPSRRSCPPST
jgi:hypothetical protein